MDARGLEKELRLCCNRKKLYSFTKYIFLFIAIVSMTVLTCLDVTKLSWQYKESKTVATISLKDNSTVGIHLPNMTICIYFANNITDLIIDKSNRMVYLIFVIYLLKHADYFASDLSNDYSERKEQWSNVIAVYTRDGRNLEEIENELAKELCRLLDVRLQLTGIYTNASPAQHINVCDNAAELTTGFTIQQNCIICFRIPLDKVAIKGKKWIDSNNVDNNYFKSFYYSNKWAPQQQALSITFVPMAIRKIIPMPNRYNSFHIISFFPEVPYLTSIPDMEDLLKKAGKKSQFIDHITYPNHFGYFRNFIRHVEMSVLTKYKSLTDNDCINVYDNTNCVVECLEKNFTQICGCSRFSYRHFTHGQKKFCTTIDYSKCAYIDLNSTQMQIHKNIPECEEECSNCSLLEFSVTKMSSILKPWDDGNLKLYFCSIFIELYGGTNQMCEDFIKIAHHYDFDSYTVIINIYNKYKMFIESNGFKESLAFTRFLFGEVSYHFSMKSFTYMEVVETWPITEEAFISQIGGTFGMYLGISCLTFFLIIIDIIKFMRKQRLKRRKNLKIVVRSKSTLLPLLYVANWKKNAKVIKQKDSWTIPTEVDVTRL